MEDFQGAFEQRRLDTEELIEKKRRTAAMHWGGCTVEVLLKAIIVSHHNITEWKTASNDPGHSITNPGHDLLDAVRRLNRLKSRMESVPGMLGILNKVQNPDGHFIDLRYSAVDPDDPRYNQWLEAYRRLVNWILKEATQL
ncbi:MAG: hypothetical protein ACOY93_09060 [Bacillota bacterium]